MKVLVDKHFNKLICSNYLQIPTYKSLSTVPMEYSTPGRIIYSINENKYYFFIIMDGNRFRGVVKTLHPYILPY